MSSIDLVPDRLGSQDADHNKISLIFRTRNCCTSSGLVVADVDRSCCNTSYYNLDNDNVNPNNSALETSAQGTMELPLYLFLYVTIVNSVIFFIGVSGNVLVIQVVARIKAMRTRMNYFLVSLSFADLLVLSVCQPSAMLEFYGKDRWLIGEAMCRIVPFLEHASLNSSVLTLMIIGFERYYAICHPLREQSRCRPAKTCAVISIIWIVSYILSLPFVFITVIEEAKFFDGSTVKVCRTKMLDIWPKVYIVFIFFAFLVLPLCILTFMYASIIWRLSSLSEEAYPGDYQNTKTLKSRRQVVRMMIALVILFFVCLLPIRIVILLIVFVAPDSMESIGFEAYTNLLSFVRIMMYVNSAGNPIIYGLLSSKFRNAFKRAVPSCKDMNRDTCRSTKNYLETQRNSKHVIPLHPVQGVNGTPL